MEPPLPPLRWAKVNISPSSPSFLHMQFCFPFGDSYILDGLSGQTRNSQRSNLGVEPSLCLMGGQDTEIITKMK